MTEPRCGPWEREGLNRLFPQYPFESACLAHDEAYTTNSRGLSRAEADALFLDAMLSSSRGFADRLRAYVYYALVRAFGWYYFPKTSHPEAKA